MNNQTPFGFFPNNQGGNFPTQPRQQCNCAGEIRNINNRINNLERQMNRLERRVRRLELSNMRPTPFGNNASNEFSDSYDSENYII